MSEYMKICKGIPVSDILGWILTGIAGAIAYKLIDHIQTSMTRHEMLKGIEETFSNIYNSQIAFVSEGKRKRHKVMVRTLIDDKENWMTKAKGENVVARRRAFYDGKESYKSP